MMTAIDNQQLRGELRRNEPLARHTTWRVGGPADLFYRPADMDDLVNFIQQLPEDTNLVWLGLGSNLLVRDGGIRGVVIAMQTVNQQLELVGENRVRVEAGVTCAKAAKFCSKHGLVGGEFLAGIPGTIGGALAMNAGAFGGETWPQVIEVETIDRFGNRHTRTPEDYEIGYRHVRLKQQDNQEWFVAGLFEFSKDDAVQGKESIKALLEKRGKTQPIGLPSCGSVFTNPANDHAARLIEASGLKGHCIGKACVSEKHANFIINTGGARAQDIEDLIRFVQAQVKQVQQIELVPEVRIVGEQSENG
jgi:UDP-N-acetylmuramate dehydrogenase